MLRIRLSRTGKKRQPSYRVVVTDVEAKRDGRIVERIGHYNPLVTPAQYHIAEDRALYWLSVGAQPSDAVLNLLKKQGTMNRLRRLRAGEKLEALVAEYEGKTVEAEAPAAPPKVAAPVEVPAVVEESEVDTAEVVETPVETLAAVEEGEADATEVVEATDTAEEAVAEAVGAIAGIDEEE